MELVNLYCIGFAGTNSENDGIEVDTARLCIQT